MSYDLFELSSEARRVAMARAAGPLPRIRTSHSSWDVGVSDVAVEAAARAVALNDDWVLVESFLGARVVDATVENDGANGVRDSVRVDGTVGAGATKACAHVARNRAGATTVIAAAMKDVAALILTKNNNI